MDRNLILLIMNLTRSKKGSIAKARAVKNSMRRNDFETHMQLYNYFLKNPLINLQYQGHCNCCQVGQITLMKKSAHNKQSLEQLLHFVLYNTFAMEANLKISSAQFNKLSSKMLSVASQNKLKSQKALSSGEHIPRKKYKKKQKQLTPQQIEVFKQAFQIFDVDHSGSIDKEQLSSLLNALGFNYNQAQTTRIFDQVDSDQSGVIELNEFINFMSKQLLDTDNLKVQVLKVFKHFDHDNTGYLDFNKLKNMLSQCYFNLDDSAIQHMIKTADTDGDGKINQYEFIRIMKKVRLI